MKSLTKTNRNVVYNIAKNIFGIIFPLITFPYISRVLGTENTGKINFVSSIVSYFSLIASLGISTYAIRECAPYKNDKDILSRVASQIFTINIISTVFAYMALSVMLMISTSISPYRYLILIQSISILMTTLGADWLNTALCDFRYITLRTFFFQIISFILMIIFVRHQKDYYIYLWISILATGGANILNYFYRKRYCKMRFIKYINVKRHLLPILILFSIQVAQTVFVNTDTTILGLVKGDYETGLYGVSTRIYTMVNSLVASITWVVMPQLTVFFASKDYKNINFLLRYALNFIIILGVPGVIGLNVLTDEIIWVLAGKEYLGASCSLHILSVSLIFSFMGGFVGNIILLPSKREKIMLISSVVSAVVNLFLNLIFIPRFGLNAAAATTAIANGVGFIIGIPFIEREIRIEKVWRIFRAPLAGGIVMMGGIYIIKKINMNVYITTGISVFVAIILYFGGLILLRDEFTLNCIEQFRKKLRRKVS